MIGTHMVKANYNAILQDQAFIVVDRVIYITWSIEDLLKLCCNQLQHI